MLRNFFNVSVETHAQKAACALYLCCQFVSCHYISVCKSIILITRYLQLCFRQFGGILGHRQSVD